MLQPKKYNTGNPVRDRLLRERDSIARVAKQVEIITKPKESIVVPTSEQRASQQIIKNQNRAKLKAQFAKGAAIRGISEEEYSKLLDKQSKLSDQPLDGADKMGKSKSKGSCSPGVNDKKKAASSGVDYAYGSSGVGNNYVVPPSMTMAQNDIMNAKAEKEALQNPWIPITTMTGSLLADNMGMFASMGTAKPDAAFGSNGEGAEEMEGEEVVETPAGEVAEVKGPSHEEGGVDASGLPQGTKIYSARVEKFGQTMAERKLARERKIKNLSKLLETGKNDLAIKNSYSRTMASIEKEEQEDLKTQELYGMMAAIQEYAYGTNEDGTRKYAIGTPDYGIDLTGLQKSKTSTEEWLDTNVFNPNAQDMKNAKIMGYNSTPEDENDYMDVAALLDKKYIKAGIQKHKREVSAYNKVNPETDAEVNPETDAEVNPKTNIHLGDMVGLAGNLVSAFGPMNNTLDSRAHDTPNVNSYAGFGKDALDANLKAMEYAVANKQSNIQRIDSQTNGMKRAGRNGARGINQMRAMDLAANEQAMNAGISANDSFMNTMTQLFSQQSGLENQQDSAVMQGEAARDLADRQDKDNFYTQKGKDIVSMGEGIQQTGKDVNAIKQNEMMMNIMNNLSKWGLAYDKNGNIIQKTKTV